MSPFKFYIIVLIADFQTWKSNNPAAWAIWKPRMLNGFDVVGSTRKSTNGNYAIIENRLSFFNTRQRIETFENLISGLSWVEMFPWELSAPWINAGYTNSIFSQMALNPILWGIEL